MEKTKVAEGTDFPKLESLDIAPGRYILDALPDKPEKVTLAFLNGLQLKLEANGVPLWDNVSFDGRNISIPFDVLEQTGVGWVWWVWVIAGVLALALTIAVIILVKWTLYGIKEIVEALPPLLETIGRVALPVGLAIVLVLGGMTLMKRAEAKK